jgi:hypothetical protein
MTLPRLGLALCLLMSSGCALYLGGDDDDDDCLFGGGGGTDTDTGGAAEWNAIVLRDPSTGQCQSFGGGGGGGGCDDRCGPCDDAPENDAERAPLPTWGICGSACEGLDEQTCLATSGCRAAYLDDCAGGDCAALATYVACWSTDQTGPVQGGGCGALDAHECSRHDDCSAVHSNAKQGAWPVDEIGLFSYCLDEAAGCYSDADCAPDERCNAAEVCMPPPGCGSAESEPCDAVCYGTCVPDDVPDIGECYGELLCEAVGPDCPDGTTPGIEDGCYTGYCIPLDDCEVAPLTCAEIGAEEQCIARADCTAYYEGVDCSCDAAGACECADWVFVACE